MDIFGHQALQAGYDLWEIVDFHGRTDIVQEFSKSLKAVRIASDVDTSSMSTILQIPEK